MNKIIAEANPKNDFISMTTYCLFMNRLQLGDPEAPIHLRGGENYWYRWTIEIKTDAIVDPAIFLPVYMDKAREHLRTTLNDVVMDATQVFELGPQWVSYYGLKQFVAPSSAIFRLEYRSLSGEAIYTRWPRIQVFQ